MIAGPNGSGKTTFYDRYLKGAFPIFVNADRIAADSTAPSPESRNREAAEQADGARRRLMAEGRSFAMETVFSRTIYWLTFIEQAKANGYYVWLFFLCLETPELNMARVLSRVAQGGHPVPLEKVLKRWHGSLNTAALAIPLVDELWFYDNSVSNQEHRLVGTYLEGRPSLVTDPVPLWAKRFFGQRA